MTKIREARLRRGWTQGEVAKRCADSGVPVSDVAVSQIERGLWTPRPALRKALADVLELDPIADFEPDEQVSA